MELVHSHSALSITGVNYCLKLTGGGGGGDGEHCVNVQMWAVVGIGCGGPEGESSHCGKPSDDREDLVGAGEV